jgi:hypothetical protein
MRASAVQEQRRPWPTPVERLALALAGWLPPALAVAYGGGALTGCDRASVACPGLVEPLQAGLVAGILIALLVLPRLAFIAAIGSGGLAVGALVMIVTYATAGLPQPLPEEFTAFTIGAWIAAYLAGIWVASHDWPIARPWLGRPLATAPEGPSWNRRVGITGRPARRSWPPS